jgi:hypothetical protein
MFDKTRAAHAAKKLAKLGGVDMATFSDTVTDLKERNKIVAIGAAVLTAGNIAYVALCTKKAHELEERCIDALAENTEMVNNALYGFGPEDDFDYEEDAEGGDAPAAEDD